MRGQSKGPGFIQTLLCCTQKHNLEIFKLLDVVIGDETSVYVVLCKNQIYRMNECNTVPLSVKKT